MLSLMELIIMTLLGLRLETDATANHGQSGWLEGLMQKIQFVTVRHIAYCVILLAGGADCYSQSNIQWIFGENKAQSFHSTHSKNYYISMGVFRDKNNALRLCKKLKTRHIKSGHMLLTKGVYHVFVGPIKSADDVRYIGNQLVNNKAQATKIKNTAIQGTKHKPLRTKGLITQTEQNKDRNLLKTTNSSSKVVNHNVLFDVENHPWSFTASLGYTNYQSMYLNDGQTILVRLAFGREFFINKQIAYGLELGAQNGNKMRLNVPQETLDELGGLPVQSTVKPLLDLLATAKIQPFGLSPFFGEIKGGIAYRHWQFDDRTSVNSITNIAGEVQTGIGYSINKMTTLSLLYQGVFGGNPNFSVDAASTTGSVATIPIQQGVLLGLSYVVR